jgi:hypothetical protein
MAFVISFQESFIPISKTLVATNISEMSFVDLVFGISDIKLQHHMSKLPFIAISVSNLGVEEIVSRLYMIDL